MRPYEKVHRLSVRQSYEKSRGKWNKSIYFFSRDAVTSWILFIKLRKVECKTKQTRLFFLPRRSNFVNSSHKVTKSRVQNKTNTFVFFCRDRVTSWILFTKLRKIESRTKQTRLFFCRDRVTSWILFTKYEKSRAERNKFIYFLCRNIEIHLSY